MQDHLLEDISHPHCEKSENGIKEESQTRGNVLDFVETEDDPLVRGTRKASHLGTGNEEDKKKQKVPEDLPDKDVENHKAKQYEGTPEPDKPAL